MRCAHGPCRAVVRPRLANVHQRFVRQSFPRFDDPDQVRLGVDVDAQAIELVADGFEYHQLTVARTALRDWPELQRAALVRRQQHQRVAHHLMTQKLRFTCVE